MRYRKSADGNWHEPTTKFANNKDFDDCFYGTFVPKARALGTKGVYIFDLKRGNQLFKRTLRTIYGKQLGESYD